MIVISHEISNNILAEIANSFKWRKLSDTPDHSCFCVIGWIGRNSGFKFYDIVFYNFDKWVSDTIPDKIYDASDENYIWLEIPPFPTELMMKGYNIQAEMIQKILDRG